MGLNAVSPLARFVGLMESAVALPNGKDMKSYKSVFEAVSRLKPIVHDHPDPGQPGEPMTVKHPGYELAFT